MRHGTIISLPPEEIIHGVELLWLIQEDKDMKWYDLLAEGWPPSFWDSSVGSLALLLEHG
jgi:hypothetical protein